MRKHHVWMAAGAVALGLAGTGAIAAASGSSDAPPARYGASDAPPARYGASDAPPARYGAKVGDDASLEQRAAIEALQTDAPIPVVDHEGQPSGFVRDSALSARDDRVLQKVMAGFREPKAGEDAEYDQLFEALRILDPVAVVDQKGNTTGYWSSTFQSVSEHEYAVADAEATVAKLLDG